MGDVRRQWVYQTIWMRQTISTPRQKCLLPTSGKGYSLRLGRDEVSNKIELLLQLQVKNLKYIII